MSKRPIMPVEKPYDPLHETPIYPDAPRGRFGLSHGMALAVVQLLIMWWFVGPPGFSIARVFAVLPFIVLIAILNVAIFGWRSLAERRDRLYLEKFEKRLQP